MDQKDYQIIRQLFDDYLRMYAGRDDRLTTHFSDDFSGFTGGGDFLVKTKEEWVAITRQDFAQIKDPLRIELKDLAIQSLADTIAVATGFFTIHLPIKDHILSKETARLVLIFRLESEGWKISHSSISIPYHLVREGEIYPMKELVDRNQFLEKLVAERTMQLSVANDNLQQANEKLAREIEEHKQTEAALRANQEDLKESQRIAHVGSWRLDFATNQVFWSDELHKMYGLDPALPPPPYPEHRKFLTPESWEKLTAALHNTAITGNPYELELEMLRVNGLHGWIWVHGMAVLDAEGKTVGLRGVAQDITERKQNEELLRREQVFSKSVIESLPGIFYLYTYPDLRLVLWNREHETRLGYGVGEIEGRHITDWHVPESEEAILNAIEVVMNQGSASVEASLLTKDGRPVPFILTGIRFEAWGQRYLMGIGFDITERKRAEAEAERLQAQLNQGLKMESVGRLAGGIAHDFNNMLGVILGYTELAHKKIESGQAIHSALQGIQQAAQRSADLTRQLLAFARKQTVSPKVLDLNEIVASMLNMLRRLIGENIDLAWLPGEDLGPIRMDPAQIDQVLANLCVNARDAIKDTGKVTIETHNVVLDQTYGKEHTGFVPGEYVLLELSDNGCGMNRETLSHLFEPFFTTKGIGKGTGLGLATVYGIVKQNDGFINVYSELGLGTTFKLYLPLYVAKGEQRQPEPEAKPIATGHETILLVEDEPMILEMTTLMLEAQGYTVLPAAIPGEAIRLAREHAGEIHLLMTDVVMPEMNGRDLAKNLLSLYPGLKRLFMSGYTADVIAHHGVLDEGINFIQKPFTMQDLATKIRAALADEVGSQ